MRAATGVMLVLSLLAGLVLVAGLFLDTRESWSATTRNTVFSQYGEAIALRKNSPSA